ncbi:MAG: hypothetical protein ACD_73C00820G0006 [uncultured bacterium]|nr:MAG: hypothetical protein ACD_73C00820G0006 [uncultured bacterium]
MLDSYGPLIAGSLVFYVHTLGLFLIYFPLHYFIKWPLMIFVGSQHRSYLKTHYSRQKKIPVAKPAVDKPIETAPVYSAPSQNIEEPLPNPFSKDDSVSISRQNI